MWTSARCIALFGVFSLITPTLARAADHGSRGSSSRVQHTPVQHQSSTPTPHQSGPLSYNAYWKAATSPNPPRTNQDYNRYWQKVQAQQEYHRR